MTSTSKLHAAPRFTAEDAVRLAGEHFALAVSASPLPSERDQNFRLTTPSGEEYVLKIANGEEERAVLELQNRALEILAERPELFEEERVPFPLVLPGLGGGSIAVTEGEAGRKHFLRLLTYLPGKPLAKANPHDQALLTSLGRTMGAVSRAFEGFDHPAARRELSWDLLHAGATVERMLDELASEARRELVHRFLARHQREIEPLLPELRTGVIHGDANDHNVLVQSGEDWRNRVSGIIDLGDMLHSLVVAEPAVACAYAMLDKVDPLTAAAQVVAGYHSVHPLEPRELEVLFGLACLRLCLSVCHSARQRALAPDNEYLSISERPAWELLERLDGVSPALAHYQLREACGLPPVPHSEAISRWLEENAASFHELVSIDLKGDRALVFDLSAGSSFLETSSGAVDMMCLERRLHEALARDGAAVGIGRYDEARLVYTSEQFAVPTDTLSERRTIHLGIDLFLPAGTVVHAPFAGRVHSLGHNREELDYGPTIILEHVTGDGLRFFTLHGHLTPESIQGLEPGRIVERGAVLARIGEMKDNGGWPPHLHFQVITDLLGEEGNFAGVARPSQRRLWTSLCPDPNRILGIPADRFPAPASSPQELLAIRTASLGRSLSVAYEEPLKIVRGMGSYLVSEDGQLYLDGVNNVCHVGHCHPRVVAAGQRQLAVLNTNTRYLHDNLAVYARRLLAKFPVPFSVCTFVCTGSEANELALRMARVYTGRKDLIALDDAYHGNTKGLIDISPYKHAGPGGSGPPDWVHIVPVPDGYRGPYKGQTSSTGERYAEHVSDTVARLAETGGGVAAFICESMPGCGGQIVLPDGYLAAAFEHVRRAGGVCIADEVQVGFGRTGEHFWAFESQGVVPEIVTLGKPIGNGHPLAAVVTTPEIAEAFDNGMEYFNTFGGNPVSCAIGLAVLDVIEEEGLQENARVVGRILLEELSRLKRKHPLIGDVRGLGLFLGVELVTDRETLAPAAEHANHVVNRMKEHGFLLSTDGPLKNVLKLKPPIVLSEANARRLIATLDRVLGEDCLRI